MATPTGFDFEESFQVPTKDGGSDPFTNVAINDDAGQLSNALSLNVKESYQLGVKLVEDNTGAINGVVTVAILGTVDDSLWEDNPGLANAQVGMPYKFQITPVQNDTVVVPRVFSAKWFGPNPKIYILNECGQQLVVSVTYKRCDIPAASA